MKNSIDPDQMASSEADLDLTLFSKSMPILVQQGKGWEGCVY